MINRDMYTFYQNLKVGVRVRKLFALSYSYMEDDWIVTTYVAPNN